MYLNGQQCLKHTEKNYPDVFSLSYISVRSLSQKRLILIQNGSHIVNYEKHTFYGKQVFKALETQNLYQPADEGSHSDSNLDVIHVEPYLSVESCLSVEQGEKHIKNIYTHFESRIHG